MYYLTDFHSDYPDARVIVGKCGETISLSCSTETAKSSVRSTSSSSSLPLSNVSDQLRVNFKRAKKTTNEIALISESGNVVSFI